MDNVNVMQIAKLNGFAIDSRGEEIFLNVFSSKSYSKIFCHSISNLLPKGCIYIYIYFDEYRFLKKFCPKIRKIQLKKRTELVKNS